MSETLNVTQPEVEVAENVDGKQVVTVRQSGVRLFDGLPAEAVIHQDDRGIRTCTLTLLHYI